MCEMTLTMLRKSEFAIKSFRSLIPKTESGAVEIAKEFQRAGWKIWLCKIRNGGKNV